MPQATVRIFLSRIRSRTFSSLPGVRHRLWSAPGVLVNFVPIQHAPGPVSDTAYELVVTARSSDYKLVAAREPFCLTRSRRR